jgi:hypothetical protein
LPILLGLLFPVMLRLQPVDCEPVTDDFFAIIFANDQPGTFDVANIVF